MGIQRGLVSERSASAEPEAPATLYNPRDWIQNHLFILTEERGVHRLALTDLQRLLMEVVEIMLELEIPIRLLILKARRHRVSTWTQAVMFEDTIHHEGVNTLIVAHEDEAKTDYF